jgi:hypothetical protein
MDESYMYGEISTPFKLSNSSSSAVQHHRNNRKKRPSRRDDEDVLEQFSIPGIVAPSSPPLSHHHHHHSISAAEEEDGEKELKPKKKQQETTGAVKYEEGEEGGTTCRACKVGYFVTKDAFVDKIAAVIRKYAFVLSRQALIHAIYELSQTQREIIINDGEDDPGEWTHDEIEHHLFNCMTDSGLIFLKQISDLKDELTSLQKMLWKTNADGTREMDKNVFSVWFATQKQIKDFLSMAPEKTLAFNPKLSIQLSTRKA